MDEYQRLIADRAAAQKRKRAVFGVVLVAALGAGGYWWKQQREKALAAQAHTKKLAATRTWSRNIPRSS